MKKIILKFYLVADNQRKELTLKVIPMQAEETPYLFIHRGVWSVFIEKYSVDKNGSSTDWKDYFKINVCGGLRLHVHSDKYQINLELPVLFEE